MVFFLLQEELFVTHESCLVVTVLDPRDCGEWAIVDFWLIPFEAFYLLLL